MRRFNASDPAFDAAFDAFLAEPRGAPDDVEAAVAAVIAAVRAEGLTAVLRFTWQFDRAEITGATLRVSPEEIAAGADECPAEVRAALAFAAARIRDFHQRLMPTDGAFTDALGVE